MSTELVNYNNEAELAQYLNSLQGDDAELDELRKEANPFDVMPQLKLSKDTKEIRAVQNDETVATFSTRNPLYFIPILMTESRALWRPDSAEETDDMFPVCSTERLPIGTFKRGADRGVGTWRLVANMDLRLPEGGHWDAGDKDPPQELKIQCQSCPYNQFGSMPTWDASRDEGRGKACGEGRLIIGYVARVAHSLDNGLKIVDFDPNSTMVYAQLPATSIKAVKGIGTACLGRKVPPRKTCFVLGNDPQTSGQMAWGELTQEFAGFVAPQRLADVDRASKEMREMVFTKGMEPEVEGKEPVNKPEPVQPDGYTDHPADTIPF